MRHLIAVVLVTLAGTAGCGGRPAIPVPPSPNQVLTTLYLVGDAGLATSVTETLDVLKGDVAEAVRDQSGQVIVAYLGDNVYPDGVRSESRDGALVANENDTDQLDAQVAIVEGTTAEALFLPGNHDWNEGRDGGLLAVQQQADHLSGQANVEFLPPSGCPGPRIRNYPGVRLVIIDTQWFLQSELKEISDCPAGSLQGFADSVVLAIDSANGRRVVVLAHHPLRTHGRHSKEFHLNWHVFPLREFNEYLFVPAPGLAQLWWLTRRWIMPPDEQDIPGEANQRLREMLKQTYERASGSVFFHAAGHDHSLQVLDGTDSGAQFAIVSGSATNVSPVRSRSDTYFAQSDHGYVRVEFMQGGEARLLVVDAKNGPTWCGRLVDSGVAPC